MRFSTLCSPDHMHVVITRSMFIWTALSCFSCTADILQLQSSAAQHQSFACLNCTRVYSYSCSWDKGFSWTCSLEFQFISQCHKLVLILNWPGQTKKKKESKIPSARMTKVLKFFQRLWTFVSKLSEFPFDNDVYCYVSGSVWVRERLYQLYQRRHESKPYWNTIHAY